MISKNGMGLLILVGVSAFSMSVLAQGTNYTACQLLEKEGTHIIYGREHPTKIYNSNNSVVGTCAGGWILKTGDLYYVCGPCKGAHSLSNPLNWTKSGNIYHYSSDYMWCTPSGAGVSLAQNEGWRGYVAVKTCSGPLTLKSCISCALQFTNNLS